MARRKMRTPAEDLAVQERQNAISRQIAEESAELRRSVFIDTMIEVAAILAPERPAEPPEPHPPVDGGRWRGRRR